MTTMPNVEIWVLQKQTPRQKFKCISGGGGEETMVRKRGRKTKKGKHAIKGELSNQLPGCV